MVMEFYGRVESMNANFSNFKVKKDGDGEIFTASKNIVTSAPERGVEFEIDTRVAFTISDDGSGVLSLRKRDENED